MNIGSMVRRAVSAFGKSKTGGRSKPGPAGATGTRTTGGGSAKAGLAKKAASVAKKKL